MDENTQTLSDFKDRARADWDAVAAGWRRRDALLRRGTGPATERMLELARVSSGNQVLDVASGTGEPAISVAQRVGESGRAIGTDLSDDMLLVAREKANAAGLGNIEFHCIDGETLAFPPETFDAVTIRWGLMFMQEPWACLASCHRALKQGGRIAIACWAAPERNPFLTLPRQILESYLDVPNPPLGEPGAFAFANPVRLHSLLKSSGFKNIEIEEMELDVLEVADGQAYWDVLSDLSAPVQDLVAQLSESERNEYISAVIAAADLLRTGDTLRMKGTTWIAAGQR